MSPTWVADATIPKPPRQTWFPGVISSCLPREDDAQIYGRLMGDPRLGNNIQPKSSEVQ
jgi:hypothetical protein